MELEEAKRRATLMENERIRKQNENQVKQELESMPFHLRLQHESQKQWRKRFEENQEHSCLIFLDRHYKSYKFDQEDKIMLFSEFLKLFYEGKVKGFFRYLKEQGYKTDFQLNYKELKHES